MKSMTGVSRLPKLPMSPDCLMIWVGQAKVQFPHLAQMRLISGSGNAFGGLIFVPYAKKEVLGNRRPAIIPDVPDRKALRLNKNDFLFITGLRNKFFKSLTRSCNPPRGQRFLHQIFGNIAEIMTMLNSKEVFKRDCN